WWGFDPQTASSFQVVAVFRILFDSVLLSRSSYVGGSRSSAFGGGAPVVVLWCCGGVVVGLWWCCGGAVVVLWWWCGAAVVVVIW
ncbi:hypothetical protein Tco_0461203, partial [Tanacetum coccineum]